MKTKFILHGGFTKGRTDEDNSDFYAEILRDTNANPRILLVPFAKEPDRVIPAVEKITGEFNAVKGTKELDIDVANEKNFISQLDLADIAYFHGGRSLRLLEALKKYPELKNHLAGKVVAGESAGSNVWGTYFYSPRADQVSEGLGILPIKIIPHYQNEYEGKLDSVGADLEEVLIPEYEHRAFFRENN